MFVVPIVIDAIQLKTVRTFSHIREESFELHPPSTHRNPARPMGLVLFAMFGKTSTLHFYPSQPCPRSSLPVP
jgi:hypothetical protein